MGKPGPAPEVTLEDVLEVFASRDDPAEPLTASEIAEELSCSRRTAHNKLETLAEEGKVTSKKVGGRSRVWWISEEVVSETDFMKGFGAFKGTNLADQVAEVRDEMNEDFEERQEEYFERAG